MTAAKNMWKNWQGAMGMVVIVGAVCCCVGVASAEPKDGPAKADKKRVESPAVMLEKGIYTEETLGDLDKAMKIYIEISEQAKANRKYIAQARYRLGMCLLKKNEKAKGYAALRKFIRE